MMDSVEDPSCDGIIEDTSADQLSSPDSPHVSDIFGDPQILPRVGDQYQAEIPPIRTESDCKLLKNSSNAEDLDDVAHSFLIGLPIPIMWVQDKVDDIKHEMLEFLDPNDASITNESVESENSKGDSQMDVDLSLPQHETSNMEQKYMGKGRCPVPGSLGTTWSNIEQESFLLGLYIFGKNLVQVKKFMESREMGDLLCFYYGKFYRSIEHRRWSECRKIRSRKRIQGQRIFTGWRQRELLSRLLSRVSEECQDTLLEVSKKFGEGKILLEEYVSTLKATVGIEILVEAVGIGKGKQDLTGIVMEPVKANQVIPTRSEIPIGKECSSLTFDDIIKFLTGDFRLSKARSNDLFWEAVWPRLLAKGWHSEQPKNCSYAGSKNSLVYLIPGVKKFSRRKLVKGNHYFDSVTDVLNRVASDPRLIELEILTSTETKQNQDGHSDDQHHCYLQPKLPNDNAELMKFTVVDTSLVHGEEQFRVRKLRSLPVDASNTPTSTSLLRENDGDSSDEPAVEFDSPVLPSNDQEVTDTSSPSKGMPNGPNPTNVLMDNKKVKYTDMYDKHSGKTIKCQFSPREGRGRSNYLAPATKRRRLTACSHAEKTHDPNSFSVGPELKEEEPHFQIDSLDAGENMFAEMGPSQEKASLSSSTKGSPDDSIEEGILSENCFGTSVSPEKPQPENSTDLKLPHTQLDFETGEPFITEVSPERPQPLISRRQSTRNRPLTTRALEAFACGFLTTKRKWRGVGPVSLESSTPRPSRRARGKVGISTNFDSVASVTVESKLQEVDEECNGDTNVVSGPQVRTERVA